MKIDKKKVMAAVAVVIIGAGCVAGGSVVYSKNFGGAVAVYTLDDNLAMTDYWQDNPEYDGSVGTEGIQTATLSDTQTVQDVKVKQGDSVKKGDVLFTYDSTLTNLDLQKKELAIQQLQLDLTAAQKELRTVSSYRPGVAIPGSRTTVSGGGSISFDETETAVEIPKIDGLKLIEGDGTEKKPYIYEWQDTFSYNSVFILAVTQGKDEAFVTFTMSGDKIDLSGKLPIDPSESESESESETKAPETGETQAPETQESETQAPETQAPPQTTESETQAPPQTTEAPPQTTESETQALIVPMRYQMLTSAPGSGESESESESETAAAEKKYSVAWTIQFQKVDGEYQYQLVSLTIGGVTQKIADPLDPLPEKKPDNGGGGGGGSYTDPGITYTRAEINEMIAEQQKKIKDTDLQIRQAQLEYKKLDKELNNSAVYSELEGVVSYVGESEKTDGSIFMKVYAGGGYVVKTSVNELSLGTLSIGQSVSLNNWMTGETYTGKVKSIGDYPSGSGYNGNTNASYYPVIVTVDGDVELSENNWLGVTFGGTSTDSSSFYLQNAFIRTENGKNYVYVQGEDDKLEKRQVQTGKTLWGSYKEIKSGLAMGEYIAFPYGKNVKEGAATRQAEINELYGY